MNHKYVFYVLVFSSLVTLLSCANQDSKVFSEQIKNFDLQFQNKNPEEAKTSLSLAALSAHSENDWQSVIKRSWLFSNKNLNDALVKEYAQKAYSMFPHNSFIASVNAKIALLNNDSNTAYKLSFDFEKDPRFNDILTEILLNRVENKSYEQKDLSNLVVDLNKISLLTNTSAYDINSALLNLKLGNKEEAQNAIKLAYAKNAKIDFKLAWDSGAYSVASQILENETQSPSNLLRLSGSYILSGEKEKAIQSLETLIFHYPDYSPLQYLDLSALYSASPEKQIAILEKGMSLFKTNEHLWYSGALFYLESNDTENARRCLAQIKEDEVSLNYKIISLLIDRYYAEGKALSASIQNLTLLNPDDKRLSLVSFYILSSLGQWKEYLQIYSQRIKKEEREDLFRFYTALYNLAKNDAESALSYFEEPGNDDYIFERTFAAGVLYSEKTIIQKKNIQDYKKALMMFEIAEQYCKKPKQTAKALQKEANILLLTGDIALSYEKILSSYELNPDDRDTLTLLNTIKARLNSSL